MQAGTFEYNTYIEQTIRQLVKLEEDVLRDRDIRWSHSDLRVFARVDVTVYEDQQGKYHRVINELARSHNCCLFPAASGNQYRSMLTGLLTLLLNFTEYHI